MPPPTYEAMTYTEKDAEELGEEIPHMFAWLYDGCLFDLDENIDPMTKEQATARINELRRKIALLHDVADAYNFELGVIYAKKDEW